MPDGTEFDRSGEVSSPLPVCDDCGVQAIHDIEIEVRAVTLHKRLCAEHYAETLRCARPVLDSSLRGS